ncbi:hypothetical protein GR28A_00157 [Vibrio phage vB_VcorM_GR28A]|nr:hypothetical protein GR28A_00157 [Vibrio phage vB_VcorM_GR28A]
MLNYDDALKHINNRGAHVVYNYLPHHAARHFRSVVAPNGVRIGDIRQPALDKMIKEGVLVETSRKVEGDHLQVIYKVKDHE